MANVGSREDVVQAMMSGAEGIGLFRTEGFFLAAKTLPSGDELTQYLMHCLEPIGNKTLTHEIEMSDVMNRNIRIVIATLDYLFNITGDIQFATLIDEKYIA